MAIFIKMSAAFSAQARQFCIHAAGSTRGCISPCIMVKHFPHKRTLLDIKGQHHVTQRALVHICKDIAKYGNPTAKSRGTFQRHRTKFATQTSPFGTIIQLRSLKLKKGGSIKLPFLHPAAILWVCCQERPHFKDLFSSVLKGQQLKLAIYSDEVTPGRELLKYNDKKFWTLYWSFLDFGPAALSNEDAWFTGLTVRSTTVKKLEGGLSQLIKTYLNMFFNIAGGCDFRKGVMLNVQPAESARATAASAQDTTLVLADLAMVLQNAEAHALAFGWKGTSSIKCCPLSQHRG